MYRYTPRKNILRHFEVARYRPKGYGYISSDVFSRLMKEHKVRHDYWSCSIFSRCYPGVDFYSKEIRRQVPINGVLFPVSLFEEEVV